jgi:hypothetical protein
MGEWLRGALSISKVRWLCRLRGRLDLFGGRRGGDGFCLSSPLLEIIEELNILTVEMGLELLIVLVVEGGKGYVNIWRCYVNLRLLWLCALVLDLDGSFSFLFVVCNTPLAICLGFPGLK